MNIKDIIRKFEEKGRKGKGQPQKINKNEMDEKSKIEEEERKKR